MAESTSSGILSFAREHPLMLAALVGGVALLAWWRARQGASSGTAVAPTSGGATVDPTAYLAYRTAQGANAAQIQTATIAAGTQNLGALASLIAATEGVKASESVALAGSANAANTANYGTRVAGTGMLNQLRASLAAALGSTAAQRETALAATEAGRQTSLASTAAQVTENATTTAAQQAIARYNAKVAAQAVAANLAAQMGEQATQRQLGQYQKDIARAADNTKLGVSSIPIIGGILSAFGL